MEDIKILIKLFTVQKVKQIEILSENSELSKKSSKLYAGIKNGTITNDEEAAKLLYNDSPKNAKYRVLKNRFKQRLINTLFFTDVQAYGKSTYNKVLNKCYKNWAATKILLDKGLSRNAISIMKTILKSSLQYDIDELSLLIVRDIKLHYGLYNYNRAQFNKYNKLQDELTTLVNYRTEAENHYINFGHLYSSKKSVIYNSEIKDWEIKLMTLISKTSNVDSYHLRYNLYMSQYILYQLKNDLEKQLQVTQEAVQYFKSKKDFPKRGSATFLQINGLIQLSTKNLDEALKIFKDCLSLKPKEGRLFWSAIHNYLFIIFIIKKEYKEAYKILSHVINHKAFKNIYIDFRQQWYLKEAFIQFLIRIDKIDPKENDSKKLKPFKLRKFLNEVPALSKDKSGTNLTIHIVQVLFLMIDNKYDALLNKMAALNQYSFRYLKSKEYTRSRTFIKMLTTIPEQSYDLKKIVAKTKKLQQKLLATPLVYSEQSMSIEIIPYEQLWDEVLELLSNTK